MAALDVLLLASLVALLLYYCLSYRRNYWARKKVTSLKPTNFIMGSTGDIFVNKVSLYNYHASMYHRLAPLQYGGYYNFFTPVLVVRDPDLIRTIFTKDFNYFTDRGQPLDEKNPLSQNLFNLKGEKWRILRAKLTPTFTSGKIKIMFGLMKECTAELIEMIDMSIEKEQIEVKEMMARSVSYIGNENLDRSRTIQIQMGGGGVQWKIRSFFREQSKFRSRSRCEASIEDLGLESRA